jgi:hypothetical protein
LGWPRKWASGILKLYFRNSAKPIAQVQKLDYAARKKFGHGLASRFRKPVAKVPVFL